MGSLLWRKKSALRPASATGILEWWSASGSAQTQNSDGTGGDPGDGGPVGRVTGLIGGNQLIQGTAGSKPTYRASGPTGVPAWDFDGGDFLTCDGLAATFAGTDKPMTVIAAGRLSALGASRTLFCLGAAAGTVPFHLLDYSGSAWRNTRRGDTGAAISVTASSDASTSTSIVGMVFSGTAGDLWVNRVRVGPVTAEDTPDCTFDQFSVGVSRRSTNSAFLSGHIMDVVICSAAISDAQMAGVMSYLAAINRVPL